MWPGYFNWQVCYIPCIDIEISPSVMGVVSGMLGLGSDTLYTLCTIESLQWPQWAANDHGVAGAGHYMVTPSQSYEADTQITLQGESEAQGRVWPLHCTLYTPADVTLTLLHLSLYWHRVTGGLVTDTQWLMIIHRGPGDKHCQLGESKTINLA